MQFIPHSSTDLASLTALYGLSATHYYFMSREVQLLTKEPNR